MPTSVGYGAAFAGISPLLSALTAGAPGVATVNIDNGFGGENFRQENFGELVQLEIAQSA